MTPRRLLALATVAVAFLTAACGGDGDDTRSTAAVTRTVQVDMVDVAFEPDTLDVTRGETVRFVFHNRGQVAHEAFIGDERAQEDHEADMRDDGMHHGGDSEERAVTVDPGDSGELIHTFEEAGDIEIGCHVPGHYTSGMKITVTVT